MPPAKAASPLLLAALLAATLFLLRLTQDFLEATFKNYAFYLSESLLFATFWLLFIPLFVLGRRWVGMSSGTRAVCWGRSVVALTAALGLHFLCFAAFVHLYSTCVLGHTYHFGGVLRFAVAENLSVCLLGYLPLLVPAWRNNAVMQNDIARPSDLAEGLSSLASGRAAIAPASAPYLLVKSHGSTINLPVQVVDYLIAETPYVRLCLEEKTYLHDESLTALTARLQAHGFVRIHKSTVVNLDRVARYASRGNGDYDVYLADGTQLRLSRRYRELFLRALAVYSG